MTKKRILLIGGSRFSGKQLMYKLSQENHEITVINRGKVNLKYPANVHHIPLDRLETDLLVSELRDQHFDWIFDFIAWKGPETQVLIDLFKNHIQRFIHISTGNYYHLEKPESYLTQPIFEEDEIGPINSETDPYSKGKRMIENDLFNAFRANRFPMTILRPTYIYGPDNYFERETYFFRRKELNRPILIPSPGYGFIDFIYSEDLATLCLLAAKFSKAIGEAYNASCGEVICGEDLVRLVDSWNPEQQTSKTLYYSQEDLQAINWPKNKPLYPFSSDRLMLFSPHKAIRDLGFHPRRLKDGLHQTFLWFKEHRDASFEKNYNWHDEDRLVKFIQEKEKNN